ncbi:MAG: ABC transporter ATP-binding protein [Candidatus Aminicenantes bacterium]|nr:MAG: ABC transporter ATP-binding protein [Candidatus Aminicenantes bacterium]
MGNENILETFGLTKYYKKGIVGIEDLSLSVQAGEIYGFLGSNGAGKTTTIRMLVTLLFPTSGRAEIFGRDVVKHHLEICKDIGYIPSSVRPHKHMTGEDFLDYMGRLSANGDKEYRSYLLKKFDFSQKDLKRKIKEYSSGMARKIALVQTFQHRPRLMIMDEPTQGLDPVMQHSFYELLKEYKENGGTVFISSHHLLEVEKVCDRAAIIRSGHLVAVEKIQDLMLHTGRIIQVTFKHPVNPSQLTSDAWKIVNSNETTLKAKITGDIDKIIKLLGRFDIEDLSLPNPSLQDVFLGYYRITAE